MGLKLDLIINENHHKLAQIDLHILSYIKNNIELCKSLSISQLAKNCNVSSATVLRTTQKLNFSGFSEFKYFLKNDNSAHQYQDVDTVELLNKDINQTIKMFLNNTYLKEIYEILDKADHIYTFGTGLGQRLMLEEFSRCMLNVNKHIIMIPASGELKIVANNIKKNDLIIIASWSGNIDKYRNNLVNLDVVGVPIISITNLSDNELSSIAKYNLYFQNSFKNTEYNITRSSYLTLHLVLHLLYDGYVKYINKK